jgi:uncharacterized protein YbaP (TraB family)
MITWLRDRLSRERELQMIWAVEGGRGRSYLLGSAHFFPYRFARSLRRFISRVETVLFEGPLDEESARRVVEHGSQGVGNPCLVDALGPETITRITQDLGAGAGARSSHQMFRSLLGIQPDTLDWDRIKTMRPWMAFFQIWSQYQRKNGWTYNMELDALRLAKAMGRRFHYLETIEEQIEALDKVPFERFVRFLTRTDWGESRRHHLECYLRGDLEGLRTRISEYPTVCEAIIDNRDPILYERMRKFLEEGQTLAFVGTAHCPGILTRLRADGYTVFRPPVL